MQQRNLGRHLADTRSPSTGGRVKNFLRLSKMRRDTFHAKYPPAGSSRVVQFLRIARGRTV